MIKYLHMLCLLLHLDKASAGKAGADIIAAAIDGLKSLML